MKKIFFLSLFVCQLSFGQSIMREYDFNDALFKPHGFLSVCKLYNGDLLGTTDVWDSVPFPFDTCRVKLMRMDANANLIWTKTFIPKRTFSRSLCADSTGCYFTNWGLGSYCTLVRTDTAVNPTWMRHITNSPAGFSTDIHSCRPAPGGGCYVAGTHFRYLPNDDMLWMMKFDASGNVIWSNTYASADNDISTGNTGMEITNDGSIVLPFSITHTDSLNNRTYSCGLLKLDSSGNTLWTRSFSDTLAIWPCGIKMLPDSGFIISGVTATNIGIVDICLLRTDKDGNELWYKSFDQPCQTSYPKDRHGLAVLDNGNILLGFSHDVYAFCSSGEMMEVDLSGQVISAFRLGTIITDTLSITGILPSNGNTIAFGSRVTMTHAHSTNEITYHPMTINFNSTADEICLKENIPVTTFFPVLITGSLPLTVSAGPVSYNMTLVGMQNSPYTAHDCLQNGVEDPATHNDVSVYPNPSAGTISLDIHLPSGNSCQLFLYDVNGKLLQTNTVQNNSTFLLERKGRAEGIYFIRLVAEGTTVYNGKILFAD